MIQFYPFLRGGCAETARVRRRHISHPPHARTWKISYSPLLPLLLSVPCASFLFRGVVRFKRWNPTFSQRPIRPLLVSQMVLSRNFTSVSRIHDTIEHSPRCQMPHCSAEEQTECRDRERFIPFSIRSWPRGRRLRLSPSRVSPISCTARATEQQRRHRPLHTQRAVHSSRSFFCRISLVRV